MKKYSSSFWILSLSSLLFFLSFSLLIPELPNFMRNMDAEELIGLHITFFTITALFSRPFSGKLTDSWGRVPVMMIGGIITAIASLLYPLFITVFGFIAIRFFHGFSTGFKPTGTAAYVADILPKDKRGEGMGVFSFFGVTGMGLGNYLGGEIAVHYPIEILFYTSSVTALLSVAILLKLKETLVNRKPFALKMFKVSTTDIYEPTVIKAAIVMILTSFTFGVTVTLTPDISEYLHISNKGLFFSFFTFTSLGARLIGGIISDKFGRKFILKIATIIIAIGMVCIGLANSPAELFLAALIYGFGYGFSSPGIFAWATDLCPPNNRGRAFSTVFMALEIGIGVGAWLGGYFYFLNSDNAIFIFSGAGCVSLLGFIYLLFQKSKT